MILQCCDNLKYHRLITANALLQHRIHRLDQMSLYSQDVTRFHIAPKGNSVDSNKNRTAFSTSTFTTHKYSTQLHSNLTFRGPCIVIYAYNANKTHYFSNLFW